MVNMAMVSDQLESTKKLRDGEFSGLINQQVIANCCVVQEQSMDVTWNEKQSEDGESQLGTPLSVTSATADLFSPLSSQSSKSKFMPRPVRGRGLKSRGGGSTVLPGSSNEKLSTALAHETQLCNKASQQYSQYDSGKLAIVMPDNSEVRSVNALVTGSQSDPTLMTSSCHHENRAMKQCHRPLADPSYQLTDSSGRQPTVTTEEKVMDAYIEKFSVVGYTNNGGCMGVGNNLMPIRIDPNRRPSSLQEAICMYIDYLTYENEMRTRISECAVSSPPPPLDFHREEYYRDVMCRPVNFPTARFREWLKLYNVDIEITDPDGQTVSQTTFTPATPCATLASDKPGEAPAPSMSQHFSWQLGDSESEGIVAAQRRRSSRIRGDISSQSGLTPWTPDVQPIGNSGTHHHHPTVQQLVQPQYSLPSGQMETRCDDQQICVVTPQVFSTDHIIDGIQQLQQVPFMQYNSGVIELTDQHQHLYVAADAGHQHRSTSGDILNELTDSSMFTYSVAMKDENEARSNSKGPELPCVGTMMCPLDDFSNSHLHHGVVDRSRSINERMKVENYRMHSIETAHGIDVAGQIKQSQYRNEQMPEHCIPINASDQRNIYRQGLVSHTTSSIVDGCSMGYSSMRNLPVSNENSDTLNQLETDLIHISQLHDCNNTGNYQMLIVPPPPPPPPPPRATGANMRNPNANVVHIISGSDAEISSKSPITSVQQDDPIELQYDNGVTSHAVQWHQSVGIVHSSSTGVESSAPCNNEPSFNSYNESAAAVAGLAFDELSYARQNTELLSRRYWPGALQWPPASFTGGYDTGNSLSVVEDEPLLKSAKYDDPGRR